MSTQYSAVCYGGLTGVPLIGNHAYDGETYFESTEVLGTQPAVGTPMYVISGAGLNGLTVYAGVNVVYEDAAMTIPHVFPYGPMAFYIRFGDTHALLTANSSRYDTRVYNSLSAANAALSALAADGNRTDVIEILDAFQDLYVHNISILNGQTVVTTSLAGVRTAAFHNFNINSGWVCTGINVTRSNTEIDGVLCKYSGTSNFYKLTASSTLYNVVFKNSITVDYGGTAIAMGIQVASGGHAYNCIALCTKPKSDFDIGIYTWAGNAASSVKNCLAVGFGLGIRTVGALIQNCAAIDCTIPFYNTSDIRPRKDSNNATALSDGVVYTATIGPNQAFTRPTALLAGSYYGVSLHTTGTFPTISTTPALSSTDVYDIIVAATYINIRRVGAGVNLSVTAVGSGIQKIILGLKSAADAPVIITDYDTAPYNTFVDPVNNNYRLAATSVLIDAATNPATFEAFDGLGNERPCYNNGGVEYADCGPLEFDKGFGPHPVSATLTLVGLQTGSDVVILAAGTNTILASVDQNPSSSWSYTYTSAQPVDIMVIKPGYEFFSIMNYSLGSVDASVPVSQRFDRNYS